MCEDSVDNTVDKNSRVFSLIRIFVSNTTLHQQNPHSVLNWRCRLTHVDLYNGRKTAVAVVVVHCVH